LASMAVLSYHSLFPGPLSRKWKNPSSNSILGAIIDEFYNQRKKRRRFTLITVFVLFLQQLGAASPSIQKFILHIFQPLVLGGIFFFGMILTKHPSYLIGVSILSVLGFLRVGYIFWREKFRAELVYVHEIERDWSPSSQSNLLSFVSTSSKPRDPILKEKPQPRRFFAEQGGDLENADEIEETEEERKLDPLGVVDFHSGLLKSSSNLCVEDIESNQTEPYSPDTPGLCQQNEK
jgi:hypothetical protein